MPNLLAGWTAYLPMRIGDHITAGYYGGILK